MKTITRTNPAQSPVSDETLIHLVLAGEENAYTILVKRYEGLLHSVLQSYLPGHDARQEVIQDTFLRAFRALSGFRAESKFGTWLAKIAKTTAINRLQLRRYAAWDAIEGRLDHWEADLHSNEITFEKKESCQLLHRTVQKLNPMDAKALELFYFHEQSIEEIGLITGWTSTNIKTRLSRARQRLHAALLKEGF